MQRDRDCRSWIRAMVFGAGALFAAQAEVLGQDFLTITRGDEPGDRDFEFNEETFLNILSYQQPLESEQPWLAADGGIRMALGSLTKKLFWLENELKVTAPVSESFSFSSHVRQGVDFDTSFTQVQGRAEWEFTPGVSAFVPGILSTNKGRIAAGLGGVYRDPAGKIDYVQLSWVRSFLLFDEKEDVLGQSTISEPPDTLEFQAQGDFFGWGTTTVQAANQFPSGINFVEEGRVERFRRFSARGLQRVDFENGDSIFLSLFYENADESIRPTEVEALPDSFEAWRAAAEARLEYQAHLAPDRVERIRTGLNFFRFQEDAEFPQDPTQDRVMSRRELTVYGAYRFPIGGVEKLDLETAVYLDGLANRTRFPNQSGADEDDPAFQGKLGFYLRWRFGEAGHLIFNANIDLDQFAWGGGGVQFAYTF